MNLLAPWADYFVGLAGASAALTGLIFVGRTRVLGHVPAGCQTVLVSR